MDFGGGWVRVGSGAGSGNEETMGPVLQKLSLRGLWDVHVVLKSEA